MMSFSRRVNADIRIDDKVITILSLSLFSLFSFPSPFTHRFFRAVSRQRRPSTFHPVHLPPFPHYKALHSTGGHDARPCIHVRIYMYVYDLDLLSLVSRLRGLPL